MLEKLKYKSFRKPSENDEFPFNGNCLIAEERDWYKLYWKIKRGIHSWIFFKKVGDNSYRERKWVVMYKLYNPDWWYNNI